ncbi:hypothetical protein [Tissierella sp. P1]|uniref:hypothetical protein n=1 Tax=Tissierella sp. P1 TaxID=1280483 RepID=UPI00130350EF|nr:hypothetical protein [Tissierella sp. P1]
MNNFTEIIFFFNNQKQKRMRIVKACTYSMASLLFVGLRPINSLARGEFASPLDP